jgi:hypothetical protein
MADKSSGQPSSSPSAARLIWSIDAWAALAAATVLVLIIVGTLPR